MKRFILPIVTGGAVLSLQAAVVSHDSTNNWNVAEGDAAVAANYLEQTLPGTNTLVLLPQGGTMNVSTDLSWGALWVGYGANGSIRQTGGHLTLNNAGSASGDGTLWLGCYTGYFGSYYLQDGVLEVTENNNNPQIGRQGLGFLSATGGEVKFRSGWPSLGRLGGGYGHFVVSGAGSLDAVYANQLTVGESGTGTLTVRGGGTADVSSLVLGANSSGAGYLNVCSGGVVRATRFSGGSGSVRRVNAVGGTLRAKSGGGSSGVFAQTDVRVGPGGLRFDTDGHDVKLAVPLQGNCLPVSRLAHRWSFNGDLSDSIGGQTAVLQGSQSGGIVFEDNQIRMPGAEHTKAYVSLGAGIIPANSEGVTIEMWFTPMGNGTWSRVFTCNGNNRSSEGFMVLHDSYACARTADGSGNFNNIGTFDNGRSYYVVISFCRMADRTWQMIYRKHDAQTGGELKVYEKTVAATYDPAEFAQDQFNLGWSTDPGNDDANIRFDEVRVWTRALSSEEIMTSATLGPDADLSSAPVVEKLGAGQLVLADGNDYEGATRVTAGQLVAAPTERPISRWSFNGSYADGVGNRTAVPTGGSKSQIVLGDTFVTLPGSSNNTAYLALGDDLWSNFTNEFTFEFWVRQNEARMWSRIFSFRGKDGQYTVSKLPQLFMTLVDGTDPNGDYVAVRGGETDGRNVGNRLAPWTLGQWFHVSVVGRRQGDGTWTVEFSKYDVDTGTRLKTFTETSPRGWGPEQFKGSSFNLGWSADSGNDDAAASFDEVRVWKRALTADELAASTRLGPDSLPVLGASGQTGNLPPTTDLSVASGAVFALAGANQTVKTLSGAGTVLGAGTLTVTESVRPGGAEAVGTLTLAEGGKVAGTCVFEPGGRLSFAAGSTYDVSAIKVRVADPASVVIGSPVTLMSAAGATLSGSFDVSDPSMDGLRLRVKATGEIVLSRRSGLLMIVR